MALRDPGNDVERLFTVLVEVLAEQAPERLQRAIPVSDVYQRLVPYRTYRGRLGIDQNGDYEMALLRLLAGHDRLAVLHPPEAMETLAAEADAIHPDPGLVREFAGATLSLNPAAVARVVDQDLGYAPPPEEPEPPPFALAEPEPAAPVPAPPAAPAAAPEPPEPFEPPEPPARPSAALDPRQQPACRHCGRGLPLNREVVFCPFCGQAAGERTCSACGDAIEKGWQFCATCGAPARGGG